MYILKLNLKACKNMKLKKQDAISAITNVLRSSAIRINDSKELSGISSTIIEKIQTEAHRQHGLRIESMFAYVAGALGECSLIKQEDGNGLFLTSDDNINIPDYRIILKDGDAFFVEVKNCNEKKISFKKEYIEKLNNYALLNKCPLKVAVYWRRLKIWTLISSEKLIFHENKCELKLDQALALSEMASLGDRMIGTKTPLRLRLNADPIKTSAIDENGQCQFTIGSVGLYSQNILIEDTIESNIAFQLIMAGRWNESEDVALKDNKISYIEYTYEAEIPNEEQGFNIIGNLSSIISSKYDSSTISDGKIERLSPEGSPEKFEIFIPNGYQGKYLPLWQFILQPNENYKGSPE